MRDRIDDLGTDTAVALITFTNDSNRASYAEHHELGFPILVDPGRAVYRSYGLGRGSTARIWGLKAARRYVELFRTQGLSGLRVPTEDTLQLGGDFVIGSDGTLAWGFWGDGPDDRPSVDALVAAVQASSSR